MFEIIFKTTSCKAGIQTLDWLTPSMTCTNSQSDHRILTLQGILFEKMFPYFNLLSIAGVFIYYFVEYLFRIGIFSLYLLLVLCLFSKVDFHGVDLILISQLWTSHHWSTLASLLNFLAMMFTLLTISLLIFFLLSIDYCLKLTIFFIHDMPRIFQFPFLYPVYWFHFFINFYHHFLSLSLHLIPSIHLLAHISIASIFFKY